MFCGTILRTEVGMHFVAMCIRVASHLNGFTRTTFVTFHTRHAIERNQMHVLVNPLTILATVADRATVAILIQTTASDFSLTKNLATLDTYLRERYIVFCYLSHLRRSRSSPHLLGTQRCSLVHCICHISDGEGTLDKRLLLLFVCLAHDEVDARVFLWIGLSMRCYFHD